MTGPPFSSFMKPPHVLVDLKEWVWAPHTLNDKVMSSRGTRSQGQYACRCPRNHCCTTLHRHVSAGVKAQCANHTSVCIDHAGGNGGSQERLNGNLRTERIPTLCTHAQLFVCTKVGAGSYLIVCQLLCKGQRDPLSHWRANWEDAFPNQMLLWDE